MGESSIHPSLSFNDHTSWRKSVSDDPTTTHKASSKTMEAGAWRGGKDRNGKYNCQSCPFLENHISFAPPLGFSMKPPITQIIPAYDEAVDQIRSGHAALLVTLCQVIPSSVFQMSPKRPGCFAQ